jgi:hypothetical protein
MCISLDFTKAEPEARICMQKVILGNYPGESKQETGVKEIKRESQSQEVFLSWLLLPEIIWIVF